MGSELKELGGKNGSVAHCEDYPRGGGGGAGGEGKDQRPLLKSDSSVSDGSGAAASACESVEELERKYAAFVRRDAYGTMGRGELPLREKVLVGIALVSLVPLRLVLGVGILVVYYLICRVCTLFKDPNREDEQEDYAHMVGWRREVVVRSGRFLSRAILFTLGFYWIHESLFENVGMEQSDEHERKRPGAVVSNHISYLDILYHMSSSFPSFVAKHLWQVGLTQAQPRRAHAASKKGRGVIVERVQDAHQNKHSPMMLLFPEGTTTNGDFLLPFKTGAFLAKVPILPVILRYPYQRFSPAWDSISGVRHVVFLLCQFVNHLEVIHLPAYYPSQQEMDDPKLFANNVRKLMATEGNLTLSDIGLPEKRVYHAALNGNGLPRVLHQKDE
ncbi:hypothetical protein Taro_015237 [Colocasia esculenta]|uniref:Phospholipid/glycerol acyltransferase domain-containing protein n=1 Tax=Colocasia esculenta TaxID=4460 RepID=A0A843UH11_COLES|nr:hypothetical protein [Colocasia esculenta]